ncbi:hypothetical protein [Anaeromyxobacter diazotrophicus]|uniref:hypothetical protein n=1 Tax=Anaeromyxobacter diazotrophicus TaxID=2590199 RepID=UPI00158FBD1E|nr:hypothetical protein [Anaeromyxobacter diazotrophicus]
MLWSCSAASSPSAPDAGHTALAIDAFTATPSELTEGQSTTLAWTLTGAVTITISPDVGALAADQRSVTVKPVTTTTYTLTATDDAGAPQTRAVTVTVHPRIALEIGSFTATPSDLALGQSTTLAWSLAGAAGVAISPDVGALAAGQTSVAVIPADTTTYTLTARDDAGATQSRTVTVTVHPRKVGDWTYYGAREGLSRDIRDVSADEGGNVYVAGVDALYAKQRGDEKFLRFDAANGGLSRKCNDWSYSTKVAQLPPTPFTLCPVISVAGAAPGGAFVGYDGFDFSFICDLQDVVCLEQPLAGWALDSGGADVVAFDGKSLSLTRHVLTGGPPHVVCDYLHDQWTKKCQPAPGQQPLASLPYWTTGRRLLHRVDHVAVNHNAWSLMYGDAWMGGQHATLAALIAKPQQRGWWDPIAELDASTQDEWKDARYFWEHLHPVVTWTASNGAQSVYYGQGYAVSINPQDGAPWGSNGARTAYVPVNQGGYGETFSRQDWWMGPAAQVVDHADGKTTDWMYGADIWPDVPPFIPASLGDGTPDDSVRALSHCQDGTVWVGSFTHGLAQLDAWGNVIQKVSLPDNFAGAVALACDWGGAGAGTLWIGLGTGGVLRRTTDGHFQDMTVAGAPAFASQPVRSIQLDRWGSGGRVVYFAFGAVSDKSGAITAPGGVAAYAGP